MRSTSSSSCTWCACSSPRCATYAPAPGSGASEPVEVLSWQRAFTRKAPLLEMTSGLLEGPGAAAGDAARRAELQRGATAVVHVLAQDGRGVHRVARLGGAGAGDVTDLHVVEDFGLDRAAQLDGYRE